MVFLSNWFKQETFIAAFNMKDEIYVKHLYEISNELLILNRIMKYQIKLCSPISSYLASNIEFEKEFFCYFLFSQFCVVCKTLKNKFSLI